MKKSYSLILLFALTMCQAFAQPTTNAATPRTRAAANVISVFSDAYTNLSGTDFFPYWGQPPVYITPSEITISGNKILSYPNMTYQGVQFTGQNVSNMDSLHLDIWTPNCQEIEIYLIANGAGERQVTKTLTLSPTAPGMWNPIDIKLTDYTSQNNFPLSNIFQFKFVSKTPSAASVYMDNIYFYTNKTLPTITGFTLPSNKKIGDAAFAITAPTSNSAGAFTYTSNNANVATISGTTVTITGVGTATITASQAANGIYDAGAVSSPLVVSFDAPTTGASAPPVRSANNVISVYSDSYSSLSNSDYYPYWGQGGYVTPSEVTLANSNKALYYPAMTYQGIQFTAQDVSAMDSFYMDIWTPNLSEIEIYLIADGAGERQVTKSLALSTTAPGTWNRIGIKLSDYSSQSAFPLSKIFQFKFVSKTPSAGFVYFDNIYFSKNTVLPVTLAEFNAVKVGNTAQLNWRTLSEVNNKGFAVERSADGAAWAQIQFVNAAGAGNYTTVDKSPLSGVNYYRLKQVDNDGKQAYSSTALVNFAGNNAVAFSFYPNPVKAKITVALQTIQSSKASVSLVNVNGRIIKTIPLTSLQSNSNIQISVSDIAKGNYFLVLKDGSTVKSSKVLVN